MSLLHCLKRARGSSRSTVSVGITSKSCLHTSPRLQVQSILFQMQGLSNSRETQHFNKLSRLSRIEHSPPLELLRQEASLNPTLSPDLRKSEGKSDVGGPQGHSDFLIAKRYGQEKTSTVPSTIAQQQRPPLETADLSRATTATQPAAQQTDVEVEGLRSSVREARALVQDLRRQLDGWKDLSSRQSGLKRSSEGTLAFLLVLTSACLAFSLYALENRKQELSGKEREVDELKTKLRDGEQQRRQLYTASARRYERQRELNRNLRREIERERATIVGARSWWPGFWSKQE